MTEVWQVFDQRQNGMLEEEGADALLGWFAYFSQLALFSALWPENLKVGFPADFQDYVKSHMIEAGELDGPV